jgi:hypothetical protein
MNDSEGDVHEVDKCKFIMDTLKTSPYFELNSKQEIEEMIDRIIRYCSETKDS